MVKQKPAKETYVHENLRELIELAAELGGACAINIEAENGEEGILHCADGKMCNAACRDLESKEALEEILSWKYVECRLEVLHTRPVRKMSLSLKRLLKKLDKLPLKSRKPPPPAPGAVLKQKDGLPLDGDAASQVKLDSKPQTNVITKEDTMPSPAQQVVEEAAKSVDGLIGCAVSGMDGIPIAAIDNSGGKLPVDTIVAKFALLVALSRKTLAELGTADFEESLTETAKEWVLVRLISANYFLAVVVTREAVLGNVRMVTKQAAERLAQVV